jgi:hypothetical protein
LLIQCGGCLITRRQLHNRLQAAVKANVPVTTTVWQSPGFRVFTKEQPLLSQERAETAAIISRI